jgi:hypothetical protein
MKVKKNTATPNHETVIKDSSLYMFLQLSLFRDIFFLFKAVSAQLPLQQIQDSQAEDAPLMAVQE